MQPIHIIYIPGFGDTYDTTRQRLLNLWRFKDVSVELVPMNWQSSESFEDKLGRINTAIDNAKDKRVVILGESAGGSMAIHTYATRAKDVFKVMALCGKNTTPETVSPHLYKHHPAFKTSMDKLNESVAAIPVEARKRFVSIHPLYDNVVPVRETLLPGCGEVVLPMTGHLPVIIAALTVWSYKIVRQAKAQN